MAKTTPKNGQLAISHREGVPIEGGISNIQRIVAIQEVEGGGEGGCKDCDG